MTDSLDDPFIHSLMDEYGHLGYAVWFGLIEIIAKENGKSVTGKVDISPTYLRRKLRTSPTKLRQVLDFCRSNGRLMVDFSEKIWKIDFPKIAEIKDNYTKDLQVARKKPSIEAEAETEVEKEADKEEDKKKKRSMSLRTPLLTDEEFITTLKNSPAYKGIDIDRELAKMDTWFLTPKGKGRKKTRAFIVNWLNKCEPVLDSLTQKEKDYSNTCHKCGATKWRYLQNLEGGPVCDKCIKSDTTQSGITVSQ